MVAAPGPLFALSEVFKTFGETELFRGLNLEIAKGSVVTLLGASGSGKSVLLKMLNGLLRPDRGAVLFEGQHVETMKLKALETLRVRVGMVFQGAALFDSMTVTDNVAYGLRELSFVGMNQAEVDARVLWALAVVGLKDTGSLMPAELSGGMRKRAGIARAIALKPEVILYDDPTAGLDPINAGRIARMIALLRQRSGITSILATNDLRTAFAVSDTLALLHEGMVEQSGPVAHMRASTNPIVRDFLSGRLIEEAQGHAAEALVTP